MRLSLPPLQPGQSYSVQIRTEDEDSVSQWSPAFHFTTDEDTRAPNVPGNRTWVVSGDSFHAEWDAVTQYVNSDPAYITSYDVELTANAITKTVSVPNKTDGTRISYDLSFEANRALFGTPQATVDFRVRAVDNKGLRSAWSATLQATNPPPNAPASGLIIEVTSGLDIIWDESTSNDVVSYNVYVGASSGFTPNAGNRVFTGLTTRFLYSSTTYSLQYVKVRAVDKFGSESTDLVLSGTPGSPFGGDSTPPDTPTGLTATLTTDDATLATTADVSWTMASPPTDLAGYSLQFRIFGDTAWNTYDVPTSDTDNTTNITLSALEPYVDYEFRVSAYDFGANFSAWTTIYQATGETNTNPSQPSAPTVAANTMQIQVVHDGLKNGGGAMEPDVEYYEVYASTTNGFTTYNSTTMLGTIANGPAIIGTFSIPASAGSGTGQTWYVKVIAVDRGGLKSSASPQSTDSVDLISTANIGDAVITNAKIFDLAANKITAGTGFINDLTVKSIFTLGDGVTNGIIQSDNYVAGTSGFKIDDSGVEVNSGVIRGNVLEIQNGENLLPSEYADFEATPTWFTSNIFVAQGTPAVTPTLFSRYNDQALFVSWDTQASNPIVYLGTSATDYNFYVEANQQYIISGYFFCDGPVATNVQLKVKWSTGAITTVDTSTLSTGGTGATAERLYGTVTAPSGATSAVLLIESSTLTADGGFTADGMQVEKKYGALDTPSQWRPPGITRIVGGMIRTGAIVSTATAEVWDPTGGPEGEGAYIQDSTQPAWSIDPEGDATFNNMLVRGSLVVGDVADIDNSYKYTVASANYLQGAQGWILHGDGEAEFRQVKADSFDGHSIKAGTVAAEKLTTGVMQADIAIAGSFETVGLQQDVLITTTSASTTVTSSDANFTTYDVGVEMVSASIPSGTTIVSVTNSTTVTVSNAATATSSDEAATLNRGRKVRLTSQDGIQVTEADGTPTVRIPTDSTQDVTFTGTVVATALTVNDNLSLNGTNNNIANAAQVTLASANVIGPQAPDGWNFWYYWDTWYDPNGLTSGLYGLEYDSTNDFLIACNSFFSNQFFLFDKDDGGFVGNYDMGLADWDRPYGGVTKIGSNYYVLFQNSNTGVWRLARFSTVQSNTSPTFNVAISTSVIAAGGSIPAIGNDGTNIVVAKCNSSKKIVLYKFNSSTGAHISTHTTNAYSSTYPDLSSVEYGVFDLGATNYYAVTSRGGTVMINASTYNEQVGYYFSTPQNKRPVGCAWIGSEFRTISYDGKLYHHTNLGMNLSTTTRYPTVYFKQTWYDNNATGGLHESPLSSSPTTYVLYHKRSNLVLESKSGIPNSGGSDTPNSCGFYISTGASTPDSNYKMQNPNPVTNDTSLYLESIDTGGGSHGGVSLFAGADPGLIISTSGNSYWSGDDIAQFQNLILIGTSDAATTAGNTPALRIGDITGTHLRIDGNEILAMSNNTTQGPLYLNREGLTELANGSGGQAKFGASGDTISCLTYGNTTISLNGSGNGTIAHGMGGTPSMAVVVTRNNGGAPTIFTVTNLDGTNITVRAESSTTGNAIVSTTRNCYWFAIKA